MATKKQKRAAALAKRETFLEENRRLGLKAQREARELRERRDQEITEHLIELNRERSRAVAAVLIAKTFV